jgi:hypothetical protein
MRTDFVRPAMRALAFLCLLAALSACATPDLDGRVSPHGPDRVVLGFPL